MFISHHLNRKPNSYFSSQNTGPLWVSRAIIKIDTNWCHHRRHRLIGQALQKKHNLSLGEHASLLMDGENQVTPRWACPCHSCSVKTKDDRTFDPAFLPNTIFTLCLCAQCLPSQAELMSRNSKAMKAWLWSVMHARQMLRPTAVLSLM